MKTLSRSVLVLFFAVALLGWVLLTLAQKPAVAQQTAQPEWSLRPLARLLQPDGTLNLKTGFSGSLDPGGWTLANGPGLTPRFVHSPQARPETEPAAPNAPEAIGDALWDDRFDALGLNNVAYAMAVGGNEVYVGGSFTAAGPVTTANRIAKWNSIAGSWSALGNGVNGSVYALAVSGTQAYAGGYFAAASGVAGTQGIARWDGAAWSALGHGITGTVYAIAVSGNDVYVGGWFTTLVDGVPGTLHLAKWNGASWSALGNGVNGPVYALVASGGDVYVGGSFSSASGVSNTMGIAKWNGTSWSALGNGITGTAYSIAVSGDDAYVGGSFSSASGVTGTTNIAHWSSPAGWSALGNGANLDVRALAVSGSKVYAGGYFSTVGIPYTTKLALWDSMTRSWSALGSGVGGNVNALGIGVDGVYVAGDFTSVAPGIPFSGGKPSRRIGLWHTTIPDPDDNWDPTFGVPGVKLGASVRAIAISGTNVYFGGSFTTIGGISATNVAKWNPSTGWSPLGNGVYTPLGGGTHYVTAVTVNGNDVYVGGVFEGAFNGTTLVPGTHNIAHWDGREWSGFGWGLGGTYTSVAALAVAPDGVYVGGTPSVGYNCDPRDPILKGCPVPMNYIIRWNASWTTVGDGLRCTPSCSNVAGVNALAVSGTDVYVGGEFNLAYNSSAISLTTNNIAKWNSATGWTALISGTNNGVTGVVRAIAISGSDVYAGGAINHAGGMTMTNIARWNGSRWWPLGSSVDGAVWALATSGNDVYVGYYGSKVFNANSSTVIANGIAKWNRLTNAWSPLGTGLNFPGVYAIGIGLDGVYIGGYGFTATGGKPAGSIGLWHPSTGSIAGRVLDPNNAPVPGARVFACVSPAGMPCGWGARTDAQGNYRVAGLPDGQYQLFAYPPGGACLLSGTRGPITIANGSSVIGQDIQLGAVQGIPPGTSLTPSSGTCTPVVDWHTLLTLRTQGCPGGTATYQILSGSTVIRSGTMTEGPAGRYSATIAPLHPNHGYATILITIQCPSGPPQVITFTIFIDPSGYVRTVHGTPIVSASVTLYTFDNALGDFAVVPDGDSIMSPANRANPTFTDANGHFGWDVIAGFYKVRAEKAGCVAPGNPSQTYVESALLIIPPPMTDLDLRLDCGEKVVFLPLVLR